jgi:hypothetical protein
MNESKITFLIIYFLQKRNLNERSIHELTSAIYNVKKINLFPLLIIMNKYTLFGTIGEDYVQKLIKADPDRQEKLINSFDFVKDIIGCRDAKLHKKDINLLTKLFHQEIQSFALFFENYILLDLPLTLENIEFFKKDKSEKIYRYKREVEINEKVYNILDILDTKKGKLIAKEYRLEKEILFPQKGEKGEKKRKLKSK